MISGTLAFSASVSLGLRDDRLCLSRLFLRALIFPPSVARRSAWHRMLP